MITLLLDSSGIGGIETHVATLCETLQGEGHAAEIVFLADHGLNPFHEQLAARQLPFRVLAGGLSGLSAYIRQHHPRLLHTHGYKAGILGRIAARMARVPVVSTFHAGERAAFPVSFYQRLDEVSAGLAECIAVSKPIAARLPGRVTVIPNFIALAPLDARQGRKPQIGFVGRLSHEKAPDRFCSLAARLATKADFHIFGDGPMRTTLEPRAAGYIRFHGFVTAPDRIWPELDLLVIPSRAEGLPMAALEAISRGLPVIATDVGAMAEVVGHGRAGWLVPEGADEAAVQALDLALRQWLGLTEEGRAALSKGAQLHARSSFGAAAALPLVLAAYARAGYAAAA